MNTEQVVRFAEPRVGWQIARALAAGKTAVDQTPSPAVGARVGKHSELSARVARILRPGKEADIRIELLPREVGVVERGL